MRGPCLCGDPYCGRCFPGTTIVACHGCGEELVGPMAGGDLQPVATVVWFCDGGTWRSLVEHGWEEWPGDVPCGICADAYEDGPESPRVPHVQPDPYDPVVFRCPHCGCLSHAGANDFEREVA